MSIDRKRLLVALGDKLGTLPQGTVKALVRDSGLVERLAKGSTYTSTHDWAMDCLRHAATEELQQLAEALDVSITKKDSGPRLEPVQEELLKALVDAWTQKREPFLFVRMAGGIRLTRPPLPDELARPLASDLEILARAGLIHFEQRTLGGGSFVVTAEGAEYAKQLDRTTRRSEASLNATAVVNIELIREAQGKLEGLRKALEEMELRRDERAIVDQIVEPAIDLAIDALQEQQNSTSPLRSVVGKLHQVLGKLSTVHAIPTIIGTVQVLSTDLEQLQANTGTIAGIVFEIGEVVQNVLSSLPL